MSPRSRFKNVLRVFAGLTGSFLLALLLAAAGPASAGSSGGPRIVDAVPDEATAIDGALHLLSRKPETVDVIDPGKATPGGQKILARSDAFIEKDGRVVYINRQSEVLRGARQGSSLYVCMLSAIIWHEMAHIDGADEDHAQRQEEGLWKRFMAEGRVDRVTGLRYLKLMADRHPDS